MGTARMGRDPKTSVLNENNQIHGVANVYVTDGSCMTSAACQNPSLTYMAITARAASHAAAQLGIQSPFPDSEVSRIAVTNADGEKTHG